MTTALVMVVTGRVVGGGRFDCQGDGRADRPPTPRLGVLGLRVTQRHADACAEALGTMERGSLSVCAC